MVVVDVLDEWLDSASSGQLFLSHSPSDLTRVSFDAGDDAVRELAALLGAFIRLLHDHSLPSCMSSC